MDKETSIAIQKYIIHFVNKTSIEVSEDYDLAMKDGLISKFKRAHQNGIITLEVGMNGYLYIQKSKILFIETGDVEVISNGS